MKRACSVAILISCVELILFGRILAQAPQVADPYKPNYEVFRHDYLTSDGDVSPSGDLNLTIPLMVVPGRHGHDFAINLQYNSNVTQRQQASWVGLGWSLELGAVERSVLGRSDDLRPGLGGSNNLCNDNTNNCRAETYGRLASQHPTSNWQLADQVDMYSLRIDNSSTEILPFPETINGNTLSAFSFLPLQYRPWTVEADWPEGFGPIRYFQVTKEDGTIYRYGDGAGTADYAFVTGRTQNNLYSQAFSFPYRWNLMRVEYPDGSVTSMKYNNHNYGGSRVRRNFETIFLDRSFPWVSNFFGVGNPFGNPTIEGYVEYAYASPETLFTDTHFAVFKSSTPSAFDSTERNRKLDTLILYDKETRTELRRVIFTFATQSNTINEYGMPPYENPDWISNTRLNNNQLTLVSLKIQSGFNPATDDQIPEYKFSYYNNPKISRARLAGYVGPLPGPNDPPYPGYHTEQVFATAWRLRDIFLPSGGRIGYTYEPLNNSSSLGGFDVHFDPEGRESSSIPFSYRAAPRGRLIQKRIVDTLDGSTQIWGYSYGIAVFDPPSHPNYSAYLPQTYQNIMPVPPYGQAEEYYKFYRGCSISHRWIQTTHPDGSYRKRFYTTSYKKPGFDFDPRESQPDSVLWPTPSITDTLIWSRAGKRGVVWKDQTNNSTSLYRYSYRVQGRFRDYYEYLPSPQTSNRQNKVELTSFWARLDSVVTTKDGVTSVSVNAYLPTTRESSAGNGLIKKAVTIESLVNREDEYSYAFEKYPGMSTVGMRSQLYSTTVRKNSNDDESKTFTTWGLFSNRWLPRKQWIWSASSTATTAPSDTGLQTVGIETYTYDNQGFSNVIEATDAHANTTKYFYSDNPTNPFLNTTAGLRKGYVTGIEEPQTSPLLRKSFGYNHYGFITKTIDENSDSRQYTYDKLGRLKSVLGPSAQTLELLSYHYSDWEFELSLLPNRITSQNFLGATQSTTEKRFYDGLGYERQRLMVFGTQYIVSALTYDPMRRLARRYRTYQTSPGITPDEYDSQFDAKARAYYPESGIYPYSLTTYELDPDARVRHQFYSDTVFSNSNLASNHYTKYFYGVNLAGEVPGYAANSLFKSTTTDENGWRTIRFTDKFGNHVASIVDSALLRLTTLFEYDVLGNLTRVTDPRGLASTYTYNTRSLLTAKATPDAGTTKYRYDLNGNLRFTQDAEQAPVRFTYRKYDKLNRLVETGEYNGTFETADSTTTGNPANDFPVSGGALKTKHVYDVNISGDPTARKLAGRLTCSVTENSGVRDSVFYSYDEFGRVEWQLHRLAGLAPKKLAYEYNWQGDMTKLSYFDLASPANNTYFFYEYDAAGRLARTYSGVNADGSGRIQDAAYTYRPSGQVQRLQLGSAQGVDYAYNERDWLAQINHQNLNTEPPGLPPDKFGQVLGYHNIEHIGAAQGALPQFNGNITWQIYNMSGVPFSGTSLVGNSYSYDAANRLKGANFGYFTSAWQPTPAYDVSKYAYDRNGNLDSLVRYGFNGSMMDFWKCGYYANTNRLNSIADTVGSTRFNSDIDNQSLNNFTYDARGNMIGDAQGNLSTTYDWRSLPLSVTKSGVATTYRYDAEGRRAYKGTAGGATHYYINDTQGRTIAVLNANGSIAMMNLRGLDHIGYIRVYFGTIPDSPEGGKAEGAAAALPGTRSDSRYYYLKDHLGNIKVTVNKFGAVAAYDDFDPYGMGLDGRSGVVGDPDARYKFISAEMNPELGIYQLGPRWYDQRIGMLRNVDPMQGVYPEYSPYHYGFNNPMRFVDPRGLQAEETEEQKRAKVYELEEIVVVAQRQQIDPVAVLSTFGSLTLVSPDPWDRPLGAAILAGVATYQLLQPLLTKPLASEEAAPDQSKNQGKRKYSDHAKDQMKDRGVSEHSVEEAIAKGKSRPGNTGVRTVYDLPAGQSTSGRGVTVVVETGTGEVVTVIDRGTKFK